MLNNFAISSPLYSGATIADLIIDAIHKYPDRPAFKNDEATVTYRELGEHISRIAQYFDSLGLRPGDTVAQLVVNRYEVYAVIAAIYMRGLRSVTLHAMGSEQDHEYVLTDSQARIVIVDAYHGQRGSVLQERCKNIEVWLSMGSLPGFFPLEQKVCHYKPEPLAAVGDSESIIRLAYTGGTTGQPKGVVLSNRALMVNAILDLIGKEWPAEPRYLCVAPISHGAGSFVAPTLVRGGSVTLLRGFSPDSFVDAVQRYDCNMTWMVPTMLYALLDSKRTAEVDWSRFHSLIYSAAPASPTRIRQALNQFGPVLVQSYGQTEAPNTVLTLSRTEHMHLNDQQLASAGRPYPLIRVALLDESGNEVPQGERGEVCVRGPLIMSGYLNKPAETAAALENNWLHTGDIAYRDQDGLYYIVDRKKDMIISGGFNVYPKEVEDVISAIPAVGATAVIGIPDEKWGEMVMAYIQLRPGCELSEDAVIMAVKDAKGAVATPKRVQFIPQIPLTALGKPDKKALRALHWQQTDRAVH